MVKLFIPFPISLVEPFSGFIGSLIGNGILGTAVVLLIIILMIMSTCLYRKRNNNQGIYVHVFHLLLSIHMYTHAAAFYYMYTFIPLDVYIYSIRCIHSFY